MTFANKISGNGTISIDSGTVELTGNNYAFSGYIDVASGAVAVISEDKNIGRAVLDVDGKLQINANKDWVFDNDLEGKGIVEINMGNHEFSFDEFAYTDWFGVHWRSRTRHLTRKRMLSFCRKVGSLRVRKPGNSG